MGSTIIIAGVLPKSPVRLLEGGSAPTRNVSSPSLAVLILSLPCCRCCDPHMLRPLSAFHARKRFVRPPVHKTTLTRDTFYLHFYVRVGNNRQVH